MRTVIAVLVIVVSNLISGVFDIPLPPPDRSRDS